MFEPRWGTTQPEAQTPAQGGNDAGNPGTVAAARAAHKRLFWEETSPTEARLQKSIGLLQAYIRRSNEANPRQPRHELIWIPPCGVGAHPEILPHKVADSTDGPNRIASPPLRAAAVGVLKSGVDRPKVSISSYHADCHEDCHEGIGNDGPCRLSRSDTKWSHALVSELYKSLSGRVWNFETVPVNAKLRNDKSRKDKLRILRPLDAATVPILLGMCDHGSHPHAVVEERGPCGHTFLAGHCTRWPAAESRFRRRTVDKSGGVIAVQCHFRSYSVTKQKDQGTDAVCGLGCFTESGDLGFSSHQLDFVEERASFAIYAEPYSSAHFGQWNIVIIQPEGWPTHREKWRAEKEAPNYKDARQRSGLDLFLTIVLGHVKAWESQWNLALSRIEENLSNNLADILNPEIRDKLMYDDVSLQRSKFYFSLLQILRCFGTSVSRSMRDLEELAGPRPGGIVGDVIDAGWAELLKEHKRSGDRLLERIAQYTDDVKILRDGLFNAVSVREAVKSTQINQYLLVFTVVTIIFLPPSFIATFYGMHLFDGPDGTTEYTQRNFWITFCVVTGGTYILAAGALTGVNKRQKIRSLLTRDAAPSTRHDWPLSSSGVKLPPGRQDVASTTGHGNSSDEKGKGKTQADVVAWGKGIFQRRSKASDAEVGV